MERGGRGKDTAKMILTEGVVQYRHRKHHQYPVHIDKEVRNVSSHGHPRSLLNYREFTAVFGKVDDLALYFLKKFRCKGYSS